ncbi:Conserved_hypothetical protein [Hexamita inflata]|uniref:Uncharacterized protein n=1 Tax=Hexamita inflata TaxID=28002 RepID=A0AA86UFD4_9EUKA|nr:Conserved hypothetical protein [Hexamita inflata]
MAEQIKSGMLSSKITKIPKMKQPKILPQNMRKSQIIISEGESIKSSQYKEDFIHGTTNAAAKLDEKTRDNIRNSHVWLGDGSVSEKFSEFRDSYRVISNNKPIHGVNPNFQSGQIKIGFENPTYKTAMNEDFLGHDMEQKYPKAVYKNQVVLGDDAPSFKTTTNDYVPFTAEEYQKQVKAPNFQKSQMKIDEGVPVSYQSEFNATYQPKQSDTKIVKESRRFQNSSIIIPEKNNDRIISSTRETLEESSKLIGVMTQQTECLHLKKSTLSVGSEAFQTATEMKQNYTQFSAQAAKSMRPANINTKENICFPDCDDKPITEKQLNFKNNDAYYNKEDSQRIKEYMTKPTDPNLQKLTKYSNYQSQRNEFQPHELQYSTEALRNKEKHVENHIVMNYDPLKNNTSATRDQLKESAALIGKPILPDVKHKQTNVTLGSDPNLYQSEARSEFIPKQGQISTLSQATKDDLKKTHYSLGFDKIDYKTETQEMIRADHIDRMQEYEEEPPAYVYPTVTYSSKPTKPQESKPTPQQIDKPLTGYEKSRPAAPTPKLHSAYTTPKTNKLQNYQPVSSQNLYEIGKRLQNGFQNETVVQRPETTGSRFGRSQNGIKWD